MRISAIKQALSDVVEITSEDGPVFFIRCAFLVSVQPELLVSGAEFNEEQTEEILNAGLIFAVERKAEEYLARCEQCRAGLEKKLLNKGFQKHFVRVALDYLEQRNLLDDKRFAFSWVRSHTVSKPQGRTRLLAELCSRGISSSDAKFALDEFFLQKNEQELCKRAYEKALRNGKSGEKLIKYMIDSGFSYKMIQMAQDDCTES